MNALLQAHCYNQMEAAIGKELLGGKEMVGLGSQEAEAPAEASVAGGATASANLEGVTQVHEQEEQKEHADDINKAPVPSGLAPKKPNVLEVREMNVM